MTKVSENKIVFKLFISGMSVKSMHAVENIEKIAKEYLKDFYELEIIDLNVRKELACEYQIVAIPTLIKCQPSPVRIIVGDLSDRKKVLNILEILE